MLTPNTSLANKYEIISVIGKGGYGRVYLGRDPELDRYVAIKELLQDSTSLPEQAWEVYQQRFRKEALALSRFSHPNVVATYALETDEDDNMYLILEYVEGSSIKELLEEQQHLPVDQALNIAIDICQAIEAIYRRDIVHRDIKPSNILVGRDGVAKLTDFGVAQVGHETHRTQESVGHPGTPAYKSPEQATSTGYLDQRSDLYALGLVLYEMLTGQIYVRNHVPPRQHNAEVPSALNAIVMRALEENPVARYQTAEEMRHDLEQVRQQSTLGQLRIVLGRWPLRRFARVAGVVAILLLALGTYRLAGVISGAVVRVESVPQTATVASPTVALTETWTPVPAPALPASPAATDTPQPTPSLPATPSPEPTPVSDSFEPDEQMPATLVAGQVQRRSFDPAGDVDRVTFRARAGYSYIVTTANLASGVDTRLEVLIGGQVLTNGDISSGAAASQVQFSASEDGTVVVTILNDGSYGPTSTYDISVIELQPTETSTLTPSPSRVTTVPATSTPRPTYTPGYTITPLYTATRTPTRTPTRTRTPIPVRTNTPRPTATNTKAVTATSKPDPTRTPGIVLPTAEKEGTPNTQ